MISLTEDILMEDILMDTHKLIANLPIFLYSLMH
jgi:hypothetical protein